MWHVVYKYVCVHEACVVCKCDIYISHTHIIHVVMMTFSMNGCVYWYYEWNQQQFTIMTQVEPGLSDPCERVNPGSHTTPH